MATSIHNNHSSQEALLWFIIEFKGSQCILDLASRRNCLFHRHSWRTLFDLIKCRTVFFLHNLQMLLNSSVLGFFLCKKDFSRRVCFTIVAEDFAFPCDSGNDTFQHSCSPCSLLLTQIALQMLSAPPEEKLAHPYIQEVHWAASRELMAHPARQVGASHLQSNPTTPSSGEWSFSSMLCYIWLNG